ncbi:hypothetical protein DCCM_4345 [Desulfocucumis palustris]|uniref:Methyltransferase type 11 domain-containing protein n=1 Tax=Desulfocucumis palustris TaxID=1898651 RepID=A0A2L2XGF5_9FIRM|nr:class I SAM-dependent methyltransferase [Desulfocucumis palustris]GBF35222.1 hypothetical protein DCCM_4345 [Desulfocucumis palustris]
MNSPDRCLVYESGPVRDATGDTIRPGGFYLTGRALGYCAFGPGAKILDVGCGTGATVEYLIDNGLDASGIDRSGVLLEAGRLRNPGLPLIQARGESLPFADSEMDGIFAECSLSLMSDTHRALSEMHRVLKSGGRLVLTDVYARNPGLQEKLRSLPLTSCLTGALSREELERKLVFNGFDIMLWEDHSNLLKDLTARLIWSHGSLDSFWRKMFAGDCDTGFVQETIAGSRPGYYLLIAGKP